MIKTKLLLFLFFTFQIVYSQVENEVSHDASDNNIYNTAGIEVKPEYPGGIQEFYKYIENNYKVPNVKGLKGMVFVSFVVEKDGSLTDIVIIRDIGYGTKAETLRVLKNSPKWKPGFHDGLAVRVLYSLPINISASI